MHTVCSILIIIDDVEKTVAELTAKGKAAIVNQF